MRKPSLIFSIYAAAGVIALTVLALIYWNHQDLYSARLNEPPNRAKTFGTRAYVSDIRLGWCDNDGKVIESNFFTDSLSVTVFLQNFDGWLIEQARNEPRLLPADLAKGFKVFEALKKNKGATTDLKPDELLEVPTIQARINHWILQERSNLRLAIAGQVFETIPPFDTTAPPTYGWGESEGETYNRVVFHLAAPKDAKELEKWHAIIRAVGGDCDAEISVARPVAGASDALRMPTLVNTDVAYGPGTKLVRRSLPLVPPMRQGSAAVAVIFTIAIILAAALGTCALRDGRGPGLAAGDQAPWSLARVVFAWWIMICVSSFAYLWAMMGEHRGILSKTVPLLLGIQGTTMLISAGYGRTQNAKPSQGFFADLISEAGEAEVSRLQMLVWNLVLGVVFLWISMFEWKMPEFDATLMTLLGISSTAYVGFKFLPQGPGGGSSARSAKTKVNKLVDVNVTAGDAGTVKIVAKGSVPTGGWVEPELRPAEPPAGETAAANVETVHFDFVATKPAAAAAEAVTPIEAEKSHPAPAAGKTLKVVVYAETNKIEKLFPT